LGSPNPHGYLKFVIEKENNKTFSLALTIEPESRYIFNMTIYLHENCEILQQILGETEQLSNL